MSLDTKMTVETNGRLETILSVGTVLNGELSDRTDLL